MFIEAGSRLIVFLTFFSVFKDLLKTDGSGFGQFKFNLENLSMTKLGFDNSALASGFVSNIFVKQAGNVSTVETGGRQLETSINADSIDKTAEMSEKKNIEFNRGQTFLNFDT